MKILNSQEGWEVEEGCGHDFGGALEGAGIILVEDIIEIKNVVIKYYILDEDMEGSPE